MITTRSLLRERVTAGWIWWKRQRAKKRRFSASSRRACRAERCRRFWVGRSLYPCVRARRISRFARRSELRWHTTRVRPGGEERSADASERIFGTWPPANGWTPRSGRGFGQYDVRSMCASAAEAKTARTSAATPLARATLLALGRPAKRRRTYQAGARDAPVGAKRGRARRACLPAARGRSARPWAGARPPRPAG